MNFRDIFGVSLVLLPAVSVSSSYEDAYDDLSGVPGYIRHTACYKYDMVSGNIREAVRSLSKAEYLATKQLSAEGYSSSDIEIALFASKEYLTAQYEQLYIACNLDEGGCRLSVIKDICSGSIP